MSHARSPRIPCALDEEIQKPVDGYEKRVQA